MAVESEDAAGEDLDGGERGERFDGLATGDHGHLRVTKNGTVSIPTRRGRFVTTKGFSGRSGEEVRAVGAGACEGLLVFPCGDFGVIAGEEDFGDFHALEVDGAGVGGGF